MSIPTDAERDQPGSGQDAGQKRKLIILLVLLSILPVVWLVVLIGPSTILDTLAGTTPEVAEERAVGNPPEGETTPDRRGEAVEGGEEEIPTVAAMHELINQVQAALRPEVTEVPEDLESPFLAQWGGRLEEESPQEPRRPEMTPAEALSTVRAQLRGQLTLTGIIYDEEKPVALINGNAVVETDRVGEAVHVRKINPSSVVLSFTYREAHGELILELEEQR